MLAKCDKEGSSRRSAGIVMFQLIINSIRTGVLRISQPLINYNGMRVKAMLTNYICFGKSSTQH